MTSFKLDGWHAIGTGMTTSGVIEHFDVVEDIAAGILSGALGYQTAIDAMFEDAKVHRATLLETTSAVAVCAMVRQGLGVAIVNPITALELSGPDLVVRPLTVAISYQVNMLLPEIAAPHPLQCVLADTVRKACAALNHHHHSL